MFEALIDAGLNDPLRAVVYEKSYDSDSNRAIARKRGAVPLTPHRSNRRNTPGGFANAPTRDVPASRR